MKEVKSPEETLEKREIKLPVKTLELIGKMGLQGKCLTLHGNDAADVTMPCPGRIIVGTGHTLIVSPEKSEFIFWALEPPEFDGELPDGFAARLDIALIDSLCGSPELAQAFRSLEAAKAWVASREIRESLGPGAMLVDGELFDARTVEHGPWLFAALVKMWGIEDLFPDPPDYLAAIFDIEGAEQYLRSRSDFFAFELGGEKILGYRDKKDEEQEQRLAQKARNHEDGRLVGCRGIPIGWKELTGRFPGLEQRLLDGCEETVPLLEYQSYARMFSTDSSSVKVTCPDREEVEYPVEETVLFELNGDAEFLRRLGVNLFQPFASRIEGGLYWGNISAALSYGDPGQCKAYVNDSRKVLLHVPKGGKGSFVFLSFGQSSIRWLLGITVKNDGSIKFEPFNPKLEFEILEGLQVVKNGLLMPVIATSPVEEQKSENAN